MSTFAIIAIPFFVVALVFLSLAFQQRKPVWFILGGVFMASSLVNAVIGMASYS
ncbi:hypothetical protein [Superficieibacter electus]|uniref:hypothetical protein n=1 Tax=Superficieibacter electus TaxID=2022662 RepID=UPI00159ED122|nr:hypothetical protein [Superficieibacter electus]